MQEDDGAFGRSADVLKKALEVKAHSLGVKVPARRKRCREGIYSDVVK